MWSNWDRGSWDYQSVSAATEDEMQTGGTGDNAEGDGLE